MPTGLTVPWTATAQLVPYRIYRSPVKIPSTTLQLPAGTVIDLDASGLDGGTSFSGSPGPGDVVILFAPNGSIYQVWLNGFGAVGGVSPYISQPVFLLVGKRERMLNTVPAIPPTPQTGRVGSIGKTLKTCGW